MLSRNKREGLYMGWWRGHHERDRSGWGLRGKAARAKAWHDYFWKRIEEC